MVCKAICYSYVHIGFTTPLMVASALASIGMRSWRLPQTWQLQSSLFRVVLLHPELILWRRFWGSFTNPIFYDPFRLALNRSNWQKHSEDLLENYNCFPENSTIFKDFLYLCHEKFPSTGKNWKPFIFYTLKVSLQRGYASKATFIDRWVVVLL